MCNIDYRIGCLCEVDGCVGELESLVVFFGESLLVKVYFKFVFFGFMLN